MTFLEERDLTSAPLIPEYFTGKTIFITGGSGFIGKALIEKLLYSCPMLDRIYILLRSKNDIKPEERRDAIYNQSCFDRLRQQNAGLFESKVFVIAGDVSEPNLGISNVDRALIVNKTNIIFHSAASVRFDDTLKKATNLNLLGTKQMIELAKSVHNLECFIHVSTSYSYTHQDPVRENLNPPYADWRELLEICDMDEHTLQVLTPKFLGDMSNTYVLTKHLAEHLVCEERGKLPIVIMRPSIVTSSLKEPFPGWVDNFNGPTGIIIAGGIGIFPSLYLHPNVKSDYVPVDLVVRALITAAWLRGTKEFIPSDDIPIYNACAAGHLNISPAELLVKAKRALREVPLECTLWTIFPNFTSFKLLFIFNVVFIQLPPFLFCDCLLRLLSMKPRLIKLIRRIYITMSAIENYTMTEWRFSVDNLTMLRSALKEGDMKEFDYGIENIDVYNYFVDCVYGGKRCLLRENIENLPKAKEQYRRTRMLSAFVKAIFYVILMWYIVSKILARSTLSTFTSIFW